MAYVICKKKDIMNKIRTLFALAVLLLVSAPTGAQDVRSLETRVADLLARMPADNMELASRLMEEMYALGEQGRIMICEQIVPAGTGDDLKARYAVSSLTAHLSADLDDTRKREWEKECIGFMNRATDREVRSFFMRQLNLVGSALTVEAMKPWVLSPEMCDDAVIALQSTGTAGAADLLASALTASECPCAAQVMVALAETRPGSSIDTYMVWYQKGSTSEKSAALYAIASTGAPSAGEMLTQAAAAASWRRDQTGAVRALLIYARKVGFAGDVKKMERITSQVIAASQAPEAASQRLAAMSVITEVKGRDALGMLLEAANDPDVAIRGGALRLSSAIPGSDATKKWISRYSRVSPEAKPEIIFMLGERGDDLAVPLILKAMEDPSQEVASAAVAALARLQNRKAVDPLLAWIVKHDGEEGHRAAASALTTILDSTAITRVAETLPLASGQAAVTLIRLLAWSGDNRWFQTVFPYTSSDDPGIRTVALTSLGALASYEDQPQILGLLGAAKEKAEITELQRALLSAAQKHADPEKRSDLLIEAIEKGGDRQKLIPLLAVTGGERALNLVANEFDNGDATIRDACFDALSHWKDHSAAGQLLKITASGNKTFGMPAFDAYMRMTEAARITPESKLQMIKDIAPYAADPRVRAAMVAYTASLGLREAGVFISPYLSDPSEEVQNAALEALEALNLPDDGTIEPVLNGNNLSDKEKEAGFVSLFNGRNLDGWIGNKVSYSVEDGIIVIKPGNDSGGNLYTEKEYSDFIFRFEFLLTPGANNGLGVRTPQEGDAAYVGMELQIIDNTASIYANLKPYQYHGSVYGVIPARRGFLRPVGEWNYQEVTLQGTKVKVVLNGRVIIDGDYADAIINGTIDGKEHPGLKNSKGHIGFLGHGSVVKFRNIRLKEL
jgi:HEAT repeat protein